MSYVTVYDPHGHMFELANAKSAMLLVRDKGWTTSPPRKPEPAAEEAKELPEVPPDPGAEHTEH